MGRFGSGHWSRGFSMMKVSATFGGIGSVATSAVPIFENTSLTSGNSRSAASSDFCISTAWLRLVPGIRMRMQRRRRLRRGSG